MMIRLYLNLHIDLSQYQILFILARKWCIFYKMLIVTLTQSFDKCPIFFHLRKYFTWCNCWEENDPWCQWSYIATLTAHTSVMVPMFTLLHDLNWLKFSSSSFGFHLLKGVLSLQLCLSWIEYVSLYMQKQDQIFIILLIWYLFVVILLYTIFK